MSSIAVRTHNISILIHKAVLQPEPPHPEYEVVANEWNHSYSREKAAYPIESVRDNKFWINVARVDNTLGDRKLLPTRYGKFE